MNSKERAEALKLIYRHTHKDFKGKIDGTKTIMVLRVNNGSCLVDLNSLTDAEIAAKLTYCLKLEEKRLADNRQKKLNKL